MPGTNSQSFSQMSVQHLPGPECRQMQKLLVQNLEAAAFQLLTTDSNVHIKQWQTGELRLARIQFNSRSCLSVSCDTNISLLLWPTSPFEQQLTQPFWINDRTPLELGASHEQQWLCVAVDSQRLETSDIALLNRAFQQQWQQGENLRFQFLLQSLFAEPIMELSNSSADCYQQLFFHGVWHSLQSARQQDSVSDNSQHPRIQKVRLLLQQHLTEDIDINWLAEHCDVSVKTLYNLFNREMGITPSVFIRGIKLQAAHDDICSDPSQNVTHIATRYGFTNLSRFASYYRERFGESPSDTLRSSRSKLA